MAEVRMHLKTFFIDESHVLAMPEGSSRDKAYGVIRCEAKLVAGAADMSCSRKDVL